MAPPAQIEGHTLGEQIGRGASGEVYRLWPTRRPEDLLAVKFLVGTAFDETADNSRFSRECRALMRLDHRAVVKLRDFGIVESVPYIIMEMIEGQPLLDAASNLDHVAKVQAMAEVLDGLHQAHEQDILHRDVKPSNIIIRSSDNQAILVDFGQAYIWDGISSGETSTKLAGSQGFIPPEVGANPKHRAPTHDIFSAAVTLYKAITGNMPIVNNYVSLWNIENDLVGLDAIIRRGMAPEADRYQRADHFARDLRDWIVRFKATSVSPNQEIISSIRSQLVSRMQTAEETKRRNELKAESLKIAMSSLETQIATVAKSGFEQLAMMLQDLQAVPWQVEEKNVKVNDAQVREPAIVLGSSPESTTIFLVRSMLREQLFKTQPQSGARPGKPATIAAAPTAPYLLKPCSPQWLLLQGSLKSPSPHLRLCIISAFIRKQDELTGEVLLAIYGLVPPKSQLPRAPQLLTTPQEISDFLLRAAAKAFGINEA